MFKYIYCNKLSKQRISSAFYQEITLALLELKALSFNGLIVLLKTLPQCSPDKRVGIMRKTECRYE